MLIQKLSVHDKARTDYLASQGIRMIRFSDYDALKNSEAVARNDPAGSGAPLGKDPHPNPLP